MEGWGMILCKHGREHTDISFMPARQNMESYQIGGRWEGFNTSISFRGIIPFVLPTSYRESAEATILFGLDVVFWKVVQALLRHLLCVLVHVRAAVGNSETRSSRSSSCHGKKTYIRGCRSTMWNTHGVCATPCLYKIEPSFFFLITQKSGYLALVEKLEDLWPLACIPDRQQWTGTKVQLPIPESTHSPRHSCPRGSLWQTRGEDCIHISCLVLGRHVCLWPHLRTI